MKCPNCNEEISKNQKICKYCGKQIEVEKANTENITTLNPNFKRNNSHPWLIVGILVAIIIFGFIGIVTLSIVSDAKENGKIIKDTADEVKDKRAKEENKMVDFKEYTFTIPSSITTSVSGNKLFIYGEKNEWVVEISLQAGKYNTFVDDQNQAKILIANQDSSYDVTNSSVTEKKYANRNYLVISNIKKDSNLFEVACSKADENDLFIISSSKKDGSELTEEERESIYNIVSTNVRGV